MAEILKNGLNLSKHSLNSNLVDWLTPKKDNKNSKRRNIIKAEEVTFSSVQSRSPGMKSLSDEIKVTPMMNAEIIEGIEIVCRCGEKTVIHFDLEKDGKFN